MSDMGRIRAVAFDFDETLSDWPAAVRRAVNSLAAQPPFASETDFAERFTRIAAELYPSRTPGPLYFEVHRVFERVLTGESDCFAAADRFRSALDPAAFDDVAATLEALAGRFPLGILSNNPYAPEGLRILGFDHYFPTVIARPVDHPEAKPHPQAFTLLAAALGFAPHQVAYVGDDIEVDIDGAAAAGLAAIWLDRYDSPAQPAASPAARIASLAELPSLLETL